MQVEAQNHHGENLINSSVAATPVKVASKQMVLGMEWGSKDVFGVRKCLFAANCVLQLVFFSGEKGVQGCFLWLNSGSMHDSSAEVVMEAGGYM